MKKLYSKSLLILLIVNFFTFAQNLQAKEKKTVLPKGPIIQQITPPPELLKTLEKKIPKFKIATREDYCPALKDIKAYFRFEHGKKIAYGILSEDFNGDQLKDYALIIRQEGKYLWLAALATGKKDPAFKIKNFGPAMIVTLYHPKKDVTKNLCSGVFGLGPANSINSLKELDKKELNKKPVTNPYPYIAIESDTQSSQIFWKDGKWYETGVEL